MSTATKFDESDEKSSKQKSFRKRFADNLNAALNRRGAIPSGYGRVVGVAELFGVSQNTAANWLKGDGVPELSRLPEIADALGTTIEQLLVGDREAGTQAIDDRYVMIDMHGDDSPEGHAWYTLPETLRAVGLPNDIKMLQIDNDDMAPYVGRGDVVIYDPRVKRVQANGIYVLRIGDRYVLRRVQRGVRGNVRLICDNPAFGDEVLDESDFNAGNAEQGGIGVAGAVLGRILLGG